MTLDDISDARPDADDRRHVLRESVQRALGRFADRSTITVTEFAEIMHISRASAYETVRRGACPSIHLGERRVVVPVPGLVAMLLGVQTNGEEDMTKAPLTNRAPVLTAAHRSQPDERTDPP
jgi:hypothetical protein